jgi:hypothetical protein
MLKYIGDFDKLKDYGFEHTIYKKGIDEDYTYHSGQNWIQINVSNREFWCYNSTACNSADITDEYITTIYDLMYIGLVFKESE